jgi:hypothetical protein
MSGFSNKTKTRAVLKARLRRDSRESLAGALWKLEAMASAKAAPKWTRPPTGGL